MKRMWCVICGVFFLQYCQVGVCYYQLFVVGFGKFYLYVCVLVVVFVVGDYVFVKVGVGNYCVQFEWWCFQCGVVYYMVGIE